MIRTHSVTEISNTDCLLKWIGHTETIRLLRVNPRKRIKGTNANCLLHSMDRESVRRKALVEALEE